MGELENLARKLGDIVSYDFNSGVELLGYHDDAAQIIAVQYPSGTKSLGYHVDVTKLDFYFSRLKQLESDISKKIQRELTPRLKEAHPTDGSQMRVGNYFTLENFVEVPELIRFHKKLSGV